MYPGCALACLRLWLSHWCALYVLYNFTKNTSQRYEEVCIIEAMHMLNRFSTNNNLVYRLSPHLHNINFTDSSGDLGESVEFSCEVHHR